MWKPPTSIVMASSSTTCAVLLGGVRVRKGRPMISDVGASPNAKLNLVGISSLDQGRSKVWLALGRRLSLDLLHDAADCIVHELQILLKVELALLVGWATVAVTYSERTVSMPMHGRHHHPPPEPGCPARAVSRPHAAPCRASKYRRPGGTLTAVSRPQSRRQSLRASWRPRPHPWPIFEEGGADK